jgi:hypothetical protein
MFSAGTVASTLPPSASTVDVPTARLVARVNVTMYGRPPDCRGVGSGVGSVVADVVGAAVALWIGSSEEAVGWAEVPVGTAVARGVAAGESGPG